MSDRIQTETHFKDLIHEDRIMDEADRLPGPDGTQGTGMKFSEAIIMAQGWWDIKGRMMMPDYGKKPEEMVVKSGVMMGLPWFNLTKQEMLRVVAQWYAQIGIHTIVMSKSTSNDGEDRLLSTIRKEGMDILPVLSDEGTHKKTDTDVEEKTWEKEYEAIESEDTLIDGQGKKLTQKRNETDEQLN